MLDLSKSMTSDSSTMKFLAALAIIYVPGTFVAVSTMMLPGINCSRSANAFKSIFSTGFVNATLGHLDGVDRHQTFIQAGVYTSVTVILTFATILVPSLLRRTHVSTS